MPTILLIDDDPPVRAYLRLVLEGAGHEVREAADGGTGLELFRAQRPDLVLCDLYMPKRDGLQTVPELKSLRPDVPVIAISGGSRLFDQLLVAEVLGADETLNKPVTPSHLLLAVQRQLSRPPSPR